MIKWIDLYKEALIFGPHRNWSEMCKLAAKQEMSFSRVMSASNLAWVTQMSVPIIILVISWVLFNR